LAGAKKHVNHLLKTLDHTHTAVMSHSLHVIAYYERHELTHIALFNQRSHC